MQATKRTHDTAIFWIRAGIIAAVGTAVSLHPPYLAIVAVGSIGWSYLIGLSITAVVKEHRPSAVLLTSIIWLVLGVSSAFVFVDNFELRILWPDIEIPAVLILSSSVLPALIVSIVRRIEREYPTESGRLL